MSDADRERLLARFWAKVNKTDTCWEWTAAKGSGYGKFYAFGRMLRAHRYAYEAMVGPIPEGMQLDHLCRNRGCVNPAHMEVVTSRENTLRGVGPSAVSAKRSECRNGHPLTQENVWMCRSRSGRTWRKCRVCGVNNLREYRRRMASSSVKEGP